MFRLKLSAVSIASIVLCCCVSRANEVVSLVGNAHEDRDLFVCRKTESFDIQIIISEVTVHLPKKVRKKHLESRWTQRRFQRMWRSERVWSNPTDAREVFVSSAPRIVVCKDELIFDWDDDVQAAMVLPFLEAGKTNWHGALASQVYFPMIGVDSHRYMAEDMGADFSEISGTKLYSNSIEPFPIGRKLATDAELYVSNDVILPNGQQGVKLVQDGFDEMWCDPALNYALVKRSYNWGIGLPPRFELHYSDYEQIDGYWFPMTVELLEYSNYFKDPSNWHGKIKKTVKFSVSQIAFDSLSDKDVDALELPEGTEVVDVARGAVYRVSGSETDPFSDDGLVPYGGAFSRTRFFVIIAVGILVVAATSFFYLKARES